MQGEPAGVAVRAVTRGTEGAVLTQKSLRKPGAGEVRVRVLLAGICRTDLHAAEGRLPVPVGVTLGHEFVGVVEEVGPGCVARPGARVTATPLLPCGACGACREGREGCGQPVSLGVACDGVFADQAILPDRALFEVPASLPLPRAAYTEPMAAAMAVLKAPISPDQPGLLLGKNRIAELTLRVLRARGFERVRHEEVDAPLPADHFAFAIETVATSATILAMMRAVRPGGCVVLKSRPPEPVALDVALAVRRDLRLHAVGYGSFREAIDLLASLPVDDLLGEVYPLHRHADAFAHAHRSEAKKLFLAPGPVV
jgi:L-iditol 2-dehydrogenase